MKKQLLTLTLALSSFLGFSQSYTYHSIDDCKLLDTISTTKLGAYDLSFANPNTTGNAATLVTKLTPSETNATIIYALPDNQKLLEGDTFAFSVDLFASNVAGRFLVRLFNDEVGAAKANRGELIATTNYSGSAWQTASFNGEINATTMGRAMSQSVIDKGGYNRVVITVNNNNTSATSPIYLDNIKFDTDNTFTPLADDTADLATDNQWYYSYPSNKNATITSFSGTNTFVDDSSPSTSENSNATVLKVTREDNNATTGIKLSGADFKTTNGDNKVTLRIYPVCNIDYAVHTIRIRIRKDNDSGTQLQSDIIDLTPNEWNEVSYDISAGTAASGLYNEVYLLFNQLETVSTSGNEAVFYIDALQVPTGETLSSNTITTNNVSINAYPNPITNSFQVSGDAIKTVKLYTITGQLLKTFNKQDSYDVKDITSGIYIVNVETATGSKNLKVIKK